MLEALYLSQVTLAAASGAAGFQQLAEWSARAFGEPGDAAGPVSPPFSFSVGGVASAEALPGWRFERADGPPAEGARTTTLTWCDPLSGLVCLCDVTRFEDFPVVEWVARFHNDGSADSPILEGIQALDAGLPLTREGTAVLRHAKGSECRLDDFAPLTTSLGPNPQDPQGPWIGNADPVVLESLGGRSSCGALPFFEVDMAGHGVLGAVGWTGDWVAAFWRTDSEARMRAGMRRTHLRLLPGETIRTPRMMLLFWEGDSTAGHNMLRRFILKHHTPTVEGQPAQAPVSLATWGGNFADRHIAHGRWLKEQGLPFDYLWVDAGWYGEDEAKVGATVFNSRWGVLAGDWWPNPGYYPEGLKPVGEGLRGMGLKFLLWVEPERVYKGTTWAREHPDWLLGPLGDHYLYDLGNDEARRALADFLSGLIDDVGLGCYRQDFNTDPRPFWEAADTPDRIGMSEIRHITGLYALWDDLRARHPGLLIDNCSSGGRRIDLETISRSIPLWRSDVQCFPGFGVTGMQGQTQGLAPWVPLSTGCCDREDTYLFRSALGPGMVLCMPRFEVNLDEHFDLPWLRARMAELQSVRGPFLGDFYPLLGYSLAEDTWAAWQYDRPEQGDGIILAFRRTASPFTAMAPLLHGLAPDARYDLRDADIGEVRQFTGRELCESGLCIEIAQRPGSRLIHYTKVQ